MGNYGDGAYGDGTYGSPGSSDTTPPIVVLVSESSTKVSTIAGSNTTNVTWNVNEDSAAWQFRIVPSTGSIYTAGSLIKQATASIPANTNQITTISGAELVAATAIEGSNIVKLFAQDLAGNWSI